ncbi:Bcglc8 [Lipomyces kononenkoae]
MSSSQTSPASMASRRQPRGILKNPPPPELYHLPPPAVDHDVLQRNTRTNAAQHGDHKNANIRRLSSTSSEAARNGHGFADGSGRLKWDEANIYLTEQERTATMKITEPKTPYAHSIDLSDLVDFDDIDDDGHDIYLNGVNGNHGRDDVPGLDLGEPEEVIPAPRFSSATIVTDGQEGERRISLDENSPDQPDEHDELEEEGEERHRRFEEMRKKHYEMKDALKFAHQLQDEDEEDEVEEDEGEDEGNEEDEDEDGDNFGDEDNEEQEDA